MRHGHHESGDPTAGRRNSGAPEGQVGLSYVCPTASRRVNCQGRYFTPGLLASCAPVEAPCDPGARGCGLHGFRTHREGILSLVPKDLTPVYKETNRGHRVVRHRAVEAVICGSSLTICFLLSSLTALAHEKWFHKGPWEPANWRNVAQFPAVALIAGVAVITILAALVRRRLARPNVFPGPVALGADPDGVTRFYDVGPRDSGDSRCHATSGVRHSRASVRPVPQPGRRLAILARAHPSGRCNRFVLRRLDPSGRDRNRRGMVDWDWRVWPRADVGKQSLHRFCRVLLSRWTRTVFR